MDKITSALLHSYALILQMADEKHSPMTTRAWARAKLALERAGAPDFVNLGIKKRTKH